MRQMVTWRYKWDVGLGPLIDKRGVYSIHFAPSMKPDFLDRMIEDCHERHIVPGTLNEAEMTLTSFVNYVMLNYGFTGPNTTIDEM